MASRIQLRRDTAANWAAANPVLALAEPGLETDTNLVKYGDGVAGWNDLPYSKAVPYINEDLVPSADGVYSLGSDEFRWKDLYLTGNTIYLGSMALSDVNGQFVVEGDGWNVNLSEGTLSNRGADSSNWNELTAMGVYTVDRSSWAGVTGAPTDCMIFVGTLEVLTSTAGQKTSITQMFFPGEQRADVTVQFNRSYWGNAWTSWYKVVNDSQTVSGGTF
jgi:hypothetical protein